MISQYKLEYFLIQMIKVTESYKVSIFLLLGVSS